MTSATAETFVIGDTGGTQTGDAGEVVWTAQTTNDTTAPTASPTLNLAGRDFLTFQNITIYGGNNDPSCVNSSTTIATNIKFTRCALIAYNNNANTQNITFVGLADTAATWTISQCILVGGAISITLPTSASADYSAAILFENCLILGGGRQINVTASGAGSFKGGGVSARNCTFMGAQTAVIQILSANIATAAPNQCSLYNCIFSYCVGGVNAAASGQIVEDFNHFTGSSSTRTNVTAGVNSIVNTYPFALEFGQSLAVGGLQRPFFTPSATSPLLGVGATSAFAVSTTDLANRPRPAGGGSATTAAGVTGTATAGAATTLTNGGASFTVNAYTGYTLRLTGGTGSGQQRIVASNTSTVLTISPAWSTNPDNTSTYTIDNSGIYTAIGAFERHDTAAKETSTTQAGSSAAKIIGPGDHDYTIPVDASATVITIYARYDSTHGTTNKPQITLLANGEIGVVTETKTMTVAADTWEQITMSSFTPTAKGTVIIRCISRAAAGNGVAYFDTATGGSANTAGFDYFRRGESFGALVSGASGIRIPRGMNGGFNG